MAEKLQGVDSLDLEAAVNRARMDNDDPRLGAALLQLARHYQQLGRPEHALISLGEAAVVAERTRDDRLGMEGAQLAAASYRALSDAAMERTAQERADLHRQRLARKAAAAARPPATRPAPAPTPVAPEPRAPDPAGGHDRRDSGRNVGAAGGDGRYSPLLWIPLAALPFLVLAWRRSLRKAQALQEETERLARHQRQLKSAHQDLQQQAQQLRQTATHDALTGVLTRKAFAAALEDLVRHARHYGKPVSLMLFDLDHFKSINDSYGHLVGDAALKLAVGAVRERLDSDDLFGRFGGDEFLVGCIDLQPGQALELAEAILASVRKHAEAGDERLAPLSLSIGVATTDADQAYDIGSLFSRADAALYTAKRAGRNRAMLADEATATGGGQFPLRSLASE